MGYGTIKPHADKDLYVIFSSIVDLPVYWGTAAELLGEASKNQFRSAFYALPYFGDNYWMTLERVDQWGASSRMTGAFWDEEFSINWAGWGTVDSPDKLVQILVLLEQGKDPLSKKVKKLVTKFDWENYGVTWFTEGRTRMEHPTMEVDDVMEFKPSEQSKYSYGRYRRIM